MRNLVALVSALAILAPGLSLADDPPLIEHQPAPCTVPSKALSICAAISDDAMISKARVYFRPEKEKYFSYADMTSREVDNYDWTMMKDEVMVRGEPCWQIEGIPNTQDEIDETGYTKTIGFVRKDNFVMVRAISWLEKGGRLKYLDVAKLELIDGIWVPTEMHMATKKGKKTLHRTVLHTRNVKFGQDLDAEFFSVRRLEKGL